jgi:hypothetical protein
VRSLHDRFTTVGLGENLFDFRLPDEWLRLLVVLFQIFLDRPFQFFTLKKVPRPMRLSVSLANQRSTRVSHEELVDVKCSRKRRCLAHQFCTFGCL